MRVRPPATASAFSPLAFVGTRHAVARAYAQGCAQEMRSCCEQPVGCSLNLSPGAPGDARRLPRIARHAAERRAPPQQEARHRVHTTPPTPPIEFAARLTFTREAAGYTRRQLAERMHDTTAHDVGKWERGHAEPLGRQRIELALALGVALHFLYVPEYVAAQLTERQASLLQHAHRPRGGDVTRYVLDVVTPADERDAARLAALYLVELHDGRYRLTLHGEEVRDLTRRPVRP